MMELGDVWGDADLIPAYRYLRKHKKGIIPNSWETTFKELDDELEKVCPNSQ